MKLERNIQKTIKSALKGNRKAQKRLFDDFLPYVSTICRRYTYNESLVADAIQETFIAVFKSLDTYNPDLGTFKAWVRKVAINSSLQLARGHKSYEELGEVEELPLTTSIQIESFDNEELILLLKKMPKQYQAVFNLCIIDEFSHKEIAEVLKISEAKSRQQLSRARKWIKTVCHLEDNELKLSI